MDEQSALVTLCPECQASIVFHHEPPLDHLLLCPHCETILFVAEIRPLTLDWAFEEPIQPNSPSVPSLPHRPYWHYGVDS